MQPALGEDTQAALWRGSMRSYHMNDNEICFPINNQGGTEDSFQQLCAWVILKLNPPVPVKPSDSYSPADILIVTS